MNFRVATSGIRTRLANWRESEINPVVVKELRQAVRSWAVTGMLLLFLAVLFCTSLLILVRQSFVMNVDQRLGAQIFYYFFAILAGASILFIPLYVGVRVAAERVESNLDLLYTSTLTPGSIIRGKFMSGAYTALLFFSACMPFMTFTNLLRGVDLPSIFLLLLYLFVIVCVALQVAIFLACLPISRPFKILLGLMGMIGALIFVFPVVFFSWQLMRSGVGSMIGARGFWTGFSTSASIILVFFGLLYFLSVALISPVSANRALPLRIYITVVWLLGGGLSLFWVLRMNEFRLILPWALITFFLMLPTMVVLISNNDQLSLRVRRDIPANSPKRALAFLFFNGAAGGLVWVALLLVATFIVTHLLLLGQSPHTDSEEFLITSASTLAYIFAYALTGLFIHRKFFSHRAPKLAGLFSILIAAGVALIPGIVMFFLNQLSWRSLERLQPGNVFNIFAVRNNWDNWGIHLIFAIAWVLIMIVFNAKWFFTQVRHFRPLEHDIQPPVQSMKPPPLPQSPAQT